MVLQPQQPEEREEQRIEIPGPPRSLIPARGQIQSRIQSSNDMLQALAQQRGDLLLPGPTVAGAPRERRQRSISRLITEGVASFPHGTVSALGRYLGNEFNRITQQGEQIDAVSVQINALREQISQDVYLDGALQTLPVAIRANPELTTEEFLTLTRGDTETPPNIEQTVSFIIDEVRRDIQEQQEVAQAAVDRAADPQGRLRDLYNFNPETVAANQLIDAILSLGRFQLDEGQTPEELRNHLLELGFPRDEANSQVIDLQQQALRQSEDLREWTEQNQLLLEEGDKIGGGEITSAWKKRQWARAASQPALYLLRPIEWWVNNALQPSITAGASEAPAHLIRSLDGLISLQVQRISPRYIKKQLLPKDTLGKPVKQLLITGILTSHTS